jgi:hypothetical protein
MPIPLLSLTFPICRFSFLTRCGSAEYIEAQRFSCQMSNLGILYCLDCSAISNSLEYCKILFSLLCSGFDVEGFVMVGKTLGHYQITSQLGPSLSMHHIQECR